MREMLKENLPSDWKYDNIKNIGEVVTGNTPKSNNTEFYCDKGILWASPADLGKGKYINKTNKQLSKLGFDTTRKLPPLSIMITCIGSTIGKIGMTNSWMSTNQQINSIICNESNFAEFYYYVMEFMAKHIKSLAGTQAVPLLNKTDFSGINVPVPPLPEQQKIADILSTVDAKIEVIDQQITETQELKKGLMQRLLTKGIGHTEFKDSALGEIPVSWEVVKLGDISEIKGRIGYRGYTKLDLVEEGKGALAIGGAQITKQNKLSFSKAVYLNWEKYEESPEIKVKIGNIVFAQRGTLGRVALINFLPEKATINPSMVLIKNINCNERFLFYYLCSAHVQNIVSQISTSTAVPMISQKQIKSFNIGMPSIQEQQKIADILNSVDEKLDVLLEKKITYQELKKGLMQQLLTGKVRVRV